MRQVGQSNEDPLPTCGRMASCEPYRGQQSARIGFVMAAHVASLSLAARFCILGVGSTLMLSLLVTETYGNAVHGTSLPQETILTARLAYASDYFSFVGEDQQGHVAFALDNNRGRDGEQFQAEHFLVLHEEGKGWIEVVGNGAYDNLERALLQIPDSSYFQFQGTPRGGMTIRSAKNNLTLRIQPIVKRELRVGEHSEFWMGSAPAIMEWAGRRLSGRIIYEYLLVLNFNRLSRTYVGLWKEFQGFYISIANQGDFYLHSQQSDRLAPLVGELVGFAVFKGHADTLHDMNLEVLNRRYTLGLYRWPTEWKVRWGGANSPGSMRVVLSDRKVLSNWVIGGFAMGIIKGEMVYNGRRWPFYGLVELLM